MPLILWTDMTYLFSIWYHISFHRSLIRYWFKIALTHLSPCPVTNSKSAVTNCPLGTVRHVSQVLGQLVMWTGNRQSSSFRIWDPSVCSQWMMWHYSNHILCIYMVFLLYASLCVIASLVFVYIYNSHHIYVIYAMFFYFILHGDGRQ